jgi:sugar lactone lactonase YvrE
MSERPVERSMSIVAIAGAVTSVAAVMGASFGWPLRTAVLLDPIAGDSSPGFRLPTGMAVDRRGAVYVASAGDSSVVVFPPGASGAASPSRRLGPELGLVSPQGIALDSHGNPYIASGTHQTERQGSITMYAPGASGDAAPIRVIAGSHTELSQPPALVVAHDGRLYVVNGPKAGDTFNGLITQAGLEVLVFDPRADGDATPQRRLMEISDTLKDRVSPVQSPARTALDTTCGKPASDGSAICQVTPRDERRRQLRQPQRPDTTKPLDVALAPNGSLFVLGTRGVSTYEGGGARRRVLTMNTTSDKLPFRNFTLDRPHLATGPNGEFYLARRTLATTGQATGSSGIFFGPDPDGPFLGQMLPAPTPRSKERPTNGGDSEQTFIAVYSGRQPGDTTALRTISGSHTGFSQISDLTVGQDGSLYVLSGASIAVFPPHANGDVAPARILKGPQTGLENSTGITLDREGRIYVVGNRSVQDRVFGVGAAVTVYAADAAGDTAPIRTISGWNTRLRQPAGIAVADDGTIYVVNLSTYINDYGSVQGYAAETSANDRFSRTLIGRATGLASPQGLALDRADTLYVANGLLQRITVYPPKAKGETIPLRTLEGRNTELVSASAVALDAAGDLYVADRVYASGLNAYGPDLGAVRIYHPGASGNEAPVRTITGGYTKLNGPGGLAIDSKGNTYVPNRWGTGPGSVTIYGPEADGDVRPLRMIAGPATGLQSPVAVSLGKRDTLYVLNAASVTVYAPDVRGNAAPVRTIQAR